MSKHLRPAVLTYHCQFLLHGLSDHVGRGDVFNPQRRINGFMFFSLSVLNLEDHLGLVISPQSPLSAGYITLRACRRSLPLRFSTVTPGGIVGFLIVSYRFNIPDRLAVHLSIHARPELRAHYRSHHRTIPYLARAQRTGAQADSAGRYVPDEHFCTDVFRADNCSGSDISSDARHGNGSSGRRFGSAFQPACAPPQSPYFGSTPGVFRCTT